MANGMARFRRPAANEDSFIDPISRKTQLFKEVVFQGNTDKLFCHLKYVFFPIQKQKQITHTHTYI